MGDSITGRLGEGASHEVGGRVAARGDHHDLHALVAHLLEDGAHGVDDGVLVAVAHHDDGELGPGHLRSSTSR